MLCTTRTTTRSGCCVIVEWLGRIPRKARSAKGGVAGVVGPQGLIECGGGKGVNAGVQEAGGGREVVQQVERHLGAAADIAREGGAVHAGQAGGPAAVLRTGFRSKRRTIWVVPTLQRDCVQFGPLQGFSW